MRTAIVCLFMWCYSALGSMAQFAPQVGQTGSTAIAAASPLFVNWATACAVHRGYLNIADTALGYASAGDSSNAIGTPDASIVSLGDSGFATLTFQSPIMDGPGPDFAVFENGFINSADSNFAYLELAFVEVSSDGINFFRFPNCSHTQDTQQISNTSYMDCRLLNNLAGKYIGGFGTPFDLQELSGIPALDINHITHVRVIDVIGNISEPASLDTGGRKINDPYPTPFPSCGFDLDAVGVIHQAPLQLGNITANASFVVYPNPASTLLHVQLNNRASKLIISNINGVELYNNANAQSDLQINLAAFSSGLYLLTVINNNGQKWVQRFTVL